jgi:hypothetical protein
MVVLSPQSCILAPEEGLSVHHYLVCVDNLIECLLYW